jgi:CHASE3 domain sensor protein
VAIPLLAMLLAMVLFGVALAQDRRAQGAVLRTVEVERQIAHVRILVQAGVAGYVLTGESQYLTSYEAARRELPLAVAQLSVLVNDNPGQADRLERVRTLIRQRAELLAALVASVRADRPAATRAELLDRNKEIADELIAQLARSPHAWAPSAALPPAASSACSRSPTACTHIPKGITSGPDGNLWFTVQGAGSGGSRPPG